ncbi:LAME_0D00364g1_1 [Lachancea meyersii CBS 8951]|uniref:LAME_0D00364g1_1 n=1 Tax=Lachancea meyersii CBS 8951 TaxID=1266667 RepID=A0A1G4J6B2_9SACH|nr:LAME_0D00364g1_1 [Lachancea meyersii CBS 8951]
MVDGVSVAVGCAVGIPCGLAVVVAVIFWLQMQRRFRKEREEDGESINGDGAISFRNMEALREEQIDHLEKTEAVQQQAAEGSSSSDHTQAHESGFTLAPAAEKSGRWGLKSDSSNSKAAKPTRRNTYMPAYRKKLNSSISSLNKGSLTHQDDFRVPNDGSSTSLDTKPNAGLTSEPTVLDQMIPVLAHPDASQSVQVTPSEFSLTHERTNSNDNLIKNLQNHDFGSYPRRRSSVNLNNMPSTNVSSASVVTRSSSTRSPFKSAENVFETPVSNKITDAVPDQTADFTGHPSLDGEDITGETRPDYYMLRNNYDVKNSEEIAEEDQYENEFTNYSESKREFINSLRPRKH